MKIKKIRVPDWEINPTTGKRVWIEREKTKYTLEDEDRQKIVLDIIGGEITPEEVKEKYKIASIQSVYSWIGKYMSQQNVVFSHDINDDDMANKSKDDQIKELKEALKKAQKKADYEELRSKAYNKMIDLAEERFNIPIRKKSGTKQ